MFTSATGPLCFTGQQSSRNYRPQANKKCVLVPKGRLEIERFLFSRPQIITLQISDMSIKQLNVGFKWFCLEGSRFQTVSLHFKGSRDGSVPGLQPPLPSMSGRVGPILFLLAGVGSKTSVA